MARGKKPVRPSRPDPVVAKLLDLRDRLEAQARTDVVFPHHLPFVLLEYAFRLLARRRRQLGLDAVQELAPWLAKLVRSRALEGSRAVLLAECFWDFASDEARTWLAAQPPLAHLVPTADRAGAGDGELAPQAAGVQPPPRTRPARARDLLETPPEGLAAADRRNLIGLLREGLSEDDRAFLEREGSTLLVFLPGSSLWNELAQLADKLMTLADGTLRITPPERFEDVFARLGLEEKKGTDSSSRPPGPPSPPRSTGASSSFACSRSRSWRRGGGWVRARSWTCSWMTPPTSGTGGRSTATSTGCGAPPGYARCSSDARSSRRRACLRRRADRSRGTCHPRSERRCSNASSTKHRTKRRPTALNGFSDAIDHVWSPSFTRRMIAGAHLFDDHSAFTPLVHHGNGQVSDELAQLLPYRIPEARTFGDDLAAAWRERDEILSRF